MESNWITFLIQGPVWYYGIVQYRLFVSIDKHWILTRYPYHPLSKMKTSNILCAIFHCHKLGAKGIRLYTILILGYLVHMSIIEIYNARRPWYSCNRVTSMIGFYVGSYYTFLSLNPTIWTRNQPSIHLIMRIRQLRQDWISSNPFVEFIAMCRPSNELWGTTPCW